MNRIASAGYAAVAIGNPKAERIKYLKNLRIPSPLEFFVALEAKVHFYVVVRQTFELRAVGPMTTCAIHRQILVSLVDHFLANRVSGMFLPVVTSSAQIDRSRVIQQKDVIGGMRPVAFRTAPFLYGWMFDQRFCLSLDRIAVAGTAKRKLGSLEKSPCLRGVGGMAVLAGDLVRKGPVQPVPGKRLVHHGVVASPA